MHFTLPTLLIILQPLLFTISALPSDSTSNSLAGADAADAAVLKRSFPLDARAPKKGGSGGKSSSSGSSSNRNNKNNQDECNQSDISSASSSLSSQVASLTSSVLSNIPFATATLPGIPFPTLQPQVLATLPPVASAAYAAYTNQLASFTSRSSSCDGGQTTGLSPSSSTATGSSSSVAATQTSGVSTSASATSAATAAATPTGAAACLNAGSQAVLGLVGGAAVAVFVGM